MGKKRNIHIVPHQDGWAAKREGSKRSSVVERTKAETTKRGRDIAKRDGVELVIHNKNGRISDKDSYGNDPFPPKDTKH